MNYREKIRKAIACPQFGDVNYGEWGTLTLIQRRYIKELLDELDRADNYSKNLYFENKRLKDNWNKLKGYMIKEQARIVIENTDEDEFVYTDLLNKMQELEERSDSNE